MTTTPFEGPQAAALKDLPLPLGWRVLVAMKPVETKTAGGIILVDTESKQAVATEAFVVAAGPQAYTRDDMGGTPWVYPGDRVLVAKYAGQRHDVKIDGETHEFRILNDDEIQAKLAPIQPPAFVDGAIDAARGR